MLRKTTITVITVVLAVLAGCQSHAQNKKAAKERWAKTSAQIKLGLAQQEYDNGRIKDAAKTIRECISADPAMPAARLLSGKLLLTEENLEDAAKEFELAVELDEKLDEGWYWLGVTAQEQGRIEQAGLYYHKALTLKHTNVDYILAVAEIYAAQEEFEQAVRLLEEKIKAMPKEVSLKVAAADLMHRCGRNEQAVELYKRAMLMTSDNSYIAEALGYCYVFNGKWSEAAEIFNGLIERCEDKRMKRLYLQVTALCSMNSAQYDRAVDCYSKLSVEERDNAEIWVKMGQAMLGAGMTDRAFRCGQKAFALRPGYGDATALIGCAQYAEGDYAAAAKSFEKIGSDKKNRGLSWLMRARCYEHLGEISKAERAYKKALEINPDSELGDFLAKDKDVRNW